MSNRQHPTNPTPKKRVRLVKVIVTPVLMIDDGETLTEFDQQPVTLTPAEWATYSSERFPREVAAFEEQLNSQAQTG